MRFEVSRVLDAIEQRMSTNPVLAGAICDVGEILQAVEFDRGRPIYLPRLGSVIDALAKELDDAAICVYGVVDRALLSSLELTSNEKMVLRRWADDGLVEVISGIDPGQRLGQLAAITGLPVVSRAPVPGVRQWLAPLPGASGVVVAERRAPGPGNQAPGPGNMGGQDTYKPIIWRCPDGEIVPIPLPLNGYPCCPRHEQPLRNEGDKPPSVAVTVWVGGRARQRFLVEEGNPVVVGRSPGQEGIGLGPWLNDESMQWISRVHVELSLEGDSLTVADRSTNGTAILSASGQSSPMSRGGSRVLGDQDAVELYRGVCLAYPGWRPQDAVTAVGVMAEAPTVAIRL